MTDTEIVRLVALVHGDVHGVGYRYFVLREANARGLRGSARNVPDGTVEVIAEGPRPLVEGLLEELRRGPPAASVSYVDTDWGPPSEKFADFRIRA